MKAPVVYVFGPGTLNYKLMFINAGFKGTTNPLSADFLCLTGGADVCPALYSEPTMKTTRCDIDRDKADLEILEMFQETNRPCVGICRGGQFLNVANGGKMWQDVNNHGIRGAHEAFDLETGEVVKVSSTHHQMMRPTLEAQIVATANLSTKKVSAREWWMANVDYESSPPKGFVKELFDVEACFYEKSKTLCFQPHPEYPGFPECTKYFFELLKRHFDYSVAA